MLEWLPLTSQEYIPLSLFAKCIWSSSARSIRWPHPPLQGKEKQHGCFALELITKSRALIGWSVKFIVKTGGTRPQDKTDNKDKLLADFIAYFRACYQCKCLQTKTSLRMIGNKLNSYSTRRLRTGVRPFLKCGPVIELRLWPLAQSMNRMTM